LKKFYDKPVPVEYSKLQVESMPVDEKCPEKPVSFSQNKRHKKSQRLKSGNAANSSPMQQCLELFCFLSNLI